MSTLRSEPIPSPIPGPGRFPVRGWAVRALWTAVFVLTCALPVGGCTGDDDAGDDDAGDVCEPETEAELCSAAGRNCGDATQVDSCGESRTISCGSCDLPETCGGGGEPGVCGASACTPESDAELCTALGKNCSEISATDRCGAHRTVDCGTCSGDETCGGGGVDNVCGEPGPCVPSTNVPSGWSYLDNGVARIGVDLDYGAAIGHYSVGGVNVLDANDSGRYLQQSFYGDHMGGTWHGDPWPFNPVQGGSSDNDPSPVTEFCNNGVELYAKTIPMDWGGTGLTPCVMEEWITLEDDVAVIRFRFEFNGDWSNGARHQEVPALFVRRDLEHLTYYEGSAPWTGGAVTSILPNQLETQGNQYIGFDEPWLAYLDASDWGIGLYKRDEDSATCYRFKNIGDNSATSYFAFLDTFALTPGLVHEYTLRAKLGTLTELRAAFADYYQLGL